MLVEKGKWLVAVSGGADSMALVILCLEKHMDIMIAHVNYHHRKQAEEEEQYVKEFAKLHNIPCFIENSPFTYKGNFEAAARTYRYNFFEKIIKENKLDGVLIAHHKDDLLETYLMQKEKNLIPETYGLSSSMYYHDILVKRPLLQYTKKELEDICNKHHVKYYVDHTNFDTSLRRNHMRIDILEDKDDKQKEELYNLIQEENEKLKKIRTAARLFIKNDKVSLNAFRKQQEEIRFAIIHILTKDYYRKDHGMSLEFKKGIDHILCTQNDFIISFAKKYSIVQENGFFFVNKDIENYAWIMNTKEDRTNDYPFKIMATGEKKYSLTLQNDDLPLTIRNAKDGDEIKMRFGTKKVHRFFIDRHIPLYKRKSWPVVVNAKGTIILVPELGPDVNHYSIKPDFYVLQLENVIKGEKKC